MHVVDLDGARDGVRANADAVAAIVEAIDIPVQLAGVFETPLKHDA